MSLSIRKSTWKENIEGICDSILSNQYIKDVESDLIEKITHYLID